MWIIRLGVRGRAGIVRWVILFRSCGSFIRFILWVIVRVLRVRWVILFGSARGSHSLDYFRWLVVCGLFVRDSK